MDHAGLKKVVLEEHDYWKEMKIRAVRDEAEQITEEGKNLMERRNGMLITQRCIFSIYVLGGQVIEKVSLRTRHV